MNIQEIIHDEKKKKILIIGLIIFFLIMAGLVFLFTQNSNSTTIDNSEAQRIADFEKLKPREGFATTTLKLAPLIALTADHPVVAPGQPSKISWEVSNASSCIDVDGNPLDLKGFISITPIEPYTFDILCTGPNGTDLQSITITTSTLPIISLFAYPESIKTGEQTTIIWTVTNADRCVDKEGKTLRLSGNLPVLKAPYVFDLSCTGPKGTAKKTITIAVANPAVTSTKGQGGVSPVGASTGKRTDTGTTGQTWDTVDIAPSVALTASPENIDFNTTTTLSWVLKNVTYCVFTSDGPIGGLPAFTYSSGSRTTTQLLKTQTYTLTCTKNAGKVDKSVTVTVGPKPAAPNATITKPFDINPKYVATFGEVKASWKTTNATTCTLNKNGSPYKTMLPPNSTNYVIYENTPGVSNYILICTGEGGTTTSEPVSVRVIDCYFQSGFGNTPDSNVYGTVENSNSGPICTYTIGNPKSGTGADFSKLFGWGGSELISGVLAGLPGGEEHLCAYTYYNSYKTGNTTHSGNFFNNTTQADGSGGYHKNWKYLSSTNYTHDVNCEEHVPQFKHNWFSGEYYLMYWSNGYKVAQCPVRGPNTIKVVQSIKCQVIN